MSVRILTGDCRTELAKLPDQSVHCCVTSPPYFGLRDYGTAKWEGGDPDCDHKQGRPGSGRADGVVDNRAQRNRDGVGSMGGDCRHCGAIRIDGQIGLEATPDAFVAEMVEVFREVRRVLRGDGTLWLNLGDCYASGPSGAIKSSGLQGGQSGQIAFRTATAAKAVPDGLKQKDLIGIPWRVAFALQADGWYLRQDIIWSKPNPMPESVTDRCTKAHEYIFMMSKSARYFFDAEAIAEDASGRDPGNKTPHKHAGERFAETKTNLAVISARDTRNKRSVWTVPTSPFSEAHFATFPPALIDPCIKAGTSERGCCPACGAPWERVADKELVPTAKAAKTFIVDGRDEAADKNDQGSNRQKDGHRPGWINRTTTLGWRPTCACPEHKPVPCTVLDPFGGAGTTGLVADRLQRSSVLIELNPEYAAMAERRIHNDAPLFVEAAE